MRRLLIIMVLGLATMVLIFGQTPNKERRRSARQGGNLEQTIMALDDQLRDAALKLDVATVEKMLADDYIGIGGTGVVSTKAQTLDRYKSSRLKYESIVKSDVKVYGYGNTAFLMGAASVKGREGDNDFSGQYRYSRLFVRRAGKWQVAAFQATRVTQP